MKHYHHCFVIAYQLLTAVTSTILPPHQEPLGDHQPPRSSVRNPLKDDAFVALVNRTLAEWHVPGLSIAVIQGDEIFAEGYGYASLEDGIPVTPHTLFYTGSTTKSQTAAVLSMLIDELPDLSWTTPVSSVIRDDFVLEDAWATDHITFEDLLSHRTGLDDTTWPTASRGQPRGTWFVECGSCG